MAGTKNISNKAKDKLDAVIKKFSGSRGELAKRVDKLESMVSELYYLINTQNSTIKILLNTNNILTKSISDLSTHLKILESSSVDFAKKSNLGPVN